MPRCGSRVWLAAAKTKQRCFIELRQIVGDFKPWRLEFHEDVSIRTELWIVIQSTGRDFKPGRFRIRVRHGRAAATAEVRAVPRCKLPHRSFITVYEFPTRGEAEVFPAHSHRGKKRGAASFSAPRTVTQLERAHRTGYLEFH